MTDAARFRKFAAWLRRQRDRDDPIGDLAADFVWDTGFRRRRGEPPYRSIRELRFRVWSHGCYQARQALREAIAEFRQAQRTAAAEPPDGPGIF